MASASVAPVTTFPDEPEGWLAYLAALTRSTIGARASVAELVLYASFRSASSTLEVTESFKGEPGPRPVELELPRPNGAGAPGGIAVPTDGEPTLAFLVAGTDARWLPVGMPGALVPSWAAADFAGDVAATQWFCSLPSDPAQRSSAFAAGLDDRNVAIRASSIRAIADEALGQGVPALEAVVSAADGDPRWRVLAAVSLWLLDRRASAVSTFRSAYERTPRDRFLSMWQVQQTVDDEPPVTLYGPDPETGW